jgi:hypothetical protein
MCVYTLKTSLQRDMFSEAVNIWYQTAKRATEKKYGRRGIGLIKNV